MSAEFWRYLHARRTRHFKDPADLDIDDLVELLGLPSKRAAYNRRHRGDFPPAVLVGASLRWRRSDVPRWLTEHAERP